MKIIAVSTNKGGVLKTTITTNLAALFAEQDKRVLIVDADNQGNASLSFGKNPDKFKETLYDVLIDGLPVEKAIVNVYKNIDILPSNEDMSYFEEDVLPALEMYPRPYWLLKVAMENIKGKYDVVLIGSPPNKGLLLHNIFSWANSVIIPFQPEIFSMRSLVKTIDTINNFKEKHNNKLEIEGVLATLVDSRTTLHSEIIRECRQYCLQNNIRMFDTTIPKSIRFASAVAYDKKPAVLVDKKNPVVQKYRELMEEL